ncbi:hypothetical protein [Dehalococcoides mccartyi]|nr:hypothetical protein [Dehalococcoides mccartyi]AHB13826.1 hypothetical protein GY50_1053 [Dehalococcoides mccartyi GY50]
MEEEEKQIMSSMRKIKYGLKNILIQGYVDEDLITDKEKIKKVLITAMG